MVLDVFVSLLVRPESIQRICKHWKTLQMSCSILFGADALLDWLGCVVHTAVPKLAATCCIK